MEINNNNKLQPVKRSKLFYPVSFYTQQGYWLINNLQQSNPGHHQSNLYRINGNIEVPLFIDSVLNVIDRHEIFHTAFTLDGENPVISTNRTKPKILQVDLEDIPMDQQNKEVSRIIKECIEKPFNLSQGHLIRTALVKLKSDEFLLLLVQHIIITDNISDAIFLRDLKEFYCSRVENRESGLPKLEIHYLDYALWRTKSLQGKFLDREITYWKKKLEGAPDFLQLATDFPRLNILKNKSDALFSIQIPPDLRERLKSYIKEMKISLSTFFLSIYKLVLYHYSNQEDILVGTPYSLRNRLELQNVFGCFINTLIIRTQINPELSFREFLKQINLNIMGTYAHGSLPLEKVIEIINPERSILYSPLIQVLYNFEYEEDNQEVINPYYKIDRVNLVSEEYVYDLHLAMKGNIDHDLNMYIVYKENLFKADTIKRMAEHSIEIMKNVVDAPDMKLADLRLATEKEKGYIKNWFANISAYDYQTNFINQFEKIADKNTDHKAIVCENKNITYQELNKRANQLASYLIKKRIGFGKFVGILTDYSIDFFISALGILKTGGAYVPISPQEPINRIRFIVKDAGATLIIIKNSQIGLIDSLNTECISLDSDLHLLEQEVDLNPGIIYDPSAVISRQYHCGKTDEPVGLSVTMSSVMNNYKVFQDKIFKDDRHDEIKYGCFSSSLSEYSDRYLIQLLNGHSLYLLNEEKQENNDINVLECHCSVIKSFLQFDFLKKQGHNLKKILVYADISQYEQVWETLKVEDSIDCYSINRVPGCFSDLSVTRITGDLHKHSMCYPVQHLNHWMLDDKQQLVKPGLPGKWYVSENQHSDNQSLIDTGLIARYMDEKTIDVIAHTDRMVMLDRHPVELPAIEFALKRYPEVEDCHVYYDEPENDDSHLIGYIVVSEKIKESALKDYMASIMPSYMLPSLFISVDAIPRTDSGKVLLKALPHYKKYLNREKNVLAPKNPIERSLSKMFSQIIKVDNVGSNSNFFKMGGHSLAAAQLIAKIKNDYNIEIGIDKAYEAQTVSNLARIIEDAIAKK